LPGAFVQQNEAKHVRQPITHNDGRTKGGFVNKANQPAEADGQWHVHKQIVPPRQRGEHESNKHHHPPAPSALSTHWGGSVRTSEGLSEAKPCSLPRTDTKQSSL